MDLERIWIAFSRFGSAAGAAMGPLVVAGFVLFVFPVIGIVCVAAWAMNAVLPKVAPSFSTGCAIHSTAAKPLKPYETCRRPAPGPRTTLRTPHEPGLPRPTLR